MIEVILFLLPSFTACILILGVLGYLGMHVLEREIIFIDIALAQIAATGTALAHMFMRHHTHDGNGFIETIVALSFTLIAAAFFSYVAKNIAKISQETVIGISYAIAAAATLFFLGLAAGGDIHMEEMFTGSILWAQWDSIIMCLTVYALIGIFHYIFRSKFITLSTNYREASKTGMNVMLWDFLFYASMGIVITFTVEITGVLLTFAFLIIPATFSTLFSNRWGTRLLIGWIVGVMATIIGLFFSYRFDFSCGPALVAILGLALVGAVLIKNLLTILKGLKHNDNLLSNKSG
ncbi:metal ABC transporter permease [Candidatus Latescibacterota bacterium]